MEKTGQEDNIMETEDWQPEEKNSVEATTTTTTTTTTATAAVDQESSLEDVEDGEEASSSDRPTDVGTSVTEDDEDNKRSEPKNKTLLKIMKMLSFNKSDG